MNTFPLVSVVVPVYNREKHIKNCLTIITNQSYKNLEIIVVNDGSSDSSADIIKTFSGIKLIEHKKNRGLAAARNTGIAKATGKYIHFMDDDDQINNTFYENMVKASESNNADMACCNMINQKTKSKSQIFKKQKTYTSLEDKLKGTYVGKKGFVWRWLFKLDFLKKNKLAFEEGKLIEDLPFSFAAVFHANKIVTVPNASYLYVFNPDSILNTKNKKGQEKRREGRKHAKQFILNFAKEHGNFKIPGVNTNVAEYIFKKFLTFLSNSKTTLD